MIAVLTGWIFPWPARHERQAAIARAARQKDQAQRQLRSAQRDQQAILRMADENHFAERVARQIMGE